MKAYWNIGRALNLRPADGRAGVLFTLTQSKGKSVNLTRREAVVAHVLRKRVRAKKLPYVIETAGKGRWRLREGTPKKVVRRVWR